MEIFDVTVSVSESVPIYKGDPAVTVTAAKSIAGGNTANVTQLALGVHTATHVDAPNHFIDGTRRVHELDLTKLIGPCRVIGLPEDAREVLPEHLGDLGGVTRVLFKTRNSEFWSTPELGFRSDYTYLVPETAQALADAGVVLVGIDYLSIEKSGSPGHPVHTTLLSREIVIIEGIDLRAVEPGDYDLICLPLKYEGAGGDGSPARTVLLRR